MNIIQRVNVGDALTRSAFARPEHLAVVDGDRRWTYAEFDAWVNRLAHGLLARGYGVGDALALASGNSAEFLAVYYACAKTGVVCVPINLGWRSKEVAYVLGHSRARGIVVESGLLAGLDEVDLPETIVVGEAAPGTVAFTDVESTDDSPVEVEIPDRAPLSYLYTSGTTSFPKGVVGTHLAIHLESMSAALDSGWTAADRFVAMMPMFHTAQLNAFCTPAVVVGATIHVHRGFEPGRFLDTIERERITQVFGLPMMYRAALDHPSFGSRDLSSLRRAVYAMAPMPEAQIKACLDGFFGGRQEAEPTGWGERRGFALLFGQTEMSPITTLFRPEHQLTHVGAVGTPLTGVQVAIMDPEGNLLPRGEQGEIVYRGPSTMQEYLRNPEATAEAFRHGWFHSGDVGRFGEDGVLWFADRSKDVIKTGGENVASIEVERAVYDAEPKIAEVVVVGLPHERWSEAITAVVVPKPGETVDPAALTAALKERLDGYKVPKSVIVVDELPRTSTGKIQKNVVRETHADHYGGR
ncbi:acyl-CoA synthetase [Pseudonocardia yuanmonensis]|uniref:Acyl-CoA synthetase n=1 Tax=Pseudonocardia yuanmonensis TaxID=1095914 RepID=A0ABP8WAJ0_9PSEU